MLSNYTTVISTSIHSSLLVCEVGLVSSYSYATMLIPSMLHYFPILWYLSVVEKTAWTVLRGCWYEVIGEKWYPLLLADYESIETEHCQKKWREKVHLILLVLKLHMYTVYMSRTSLS